jgi:hypothetical protein
VQTILSDLGGFGTKIIFLKEENFVKEDEGFWE